MTVTQLLDALVDWFTPDSLKNDPHAKKRVRMFPISHPCGPVLGAPIPIFLYAYDPAPWPQVPILALSIGAFWLIPIALKLLPSLRSDPVTRRHPGDHAQRDGGPPDRARSWRRGSRHQAARRRKAALGARSAAPCRQQGERPLLTALAS